MSLITLATFSKPEEAHLVRTRLEAGEVPAFVQDENLIQMDWLYSNAIGGVRLQVWEEDVDRAQEILADNATSPLTSDWPTCPTCGSSSTAKDELPRRVSFASLMLLGFPFVFSRNRWKCQACQRAWKI